MSTTPTPGASPLTHIGPLLGALVNSPLLSSLRLKFNVGGRDVDARPVLREVANDLADGKITAAEIQGLIASVTLAIISAPAHQTTTPTPTGPSPTTPTPVPVPVLPVPPTVVSALQITRIDGEVMFIEGARDAVDATRPGLEGKFYDARTHVQMVGERAHLNFTSYAGAIRVPDEINRRLIREDGHSPALDLRWTLNGLMNWNSTQELDHFELQSYEDADAGFTPVLFLGRQAGSGQAEARCWALLEARYNHGLDVTGQIATWATD